MEEDKRKANEAPGGNASNPSPGTDPLANTSSQLIDKKGEKYLRESANIEDLPDADEEDDIEQETRNKE